LVVFSQKNAKHFKMVGWKKKLKIDQHVLSDVMDKSIMVLVD